MALLFFKRFNELRLNAVRVQIEPERFSAQAQATTLRAAAPKNELTNDQRERWTWWIGVIILMLTYYIRFFRPVSPQKLLGLSREV